MAQAWRRALLGDDGRPHMGALLILADLDTYCEPAQRAFGAALRQDGGTDPIRLGAAIGRRQVLERIRQALEPPLVRKEEPGEPGTYEAV